jgi:hypothetical protein
MTLYLITVAGAVSACTDFPFNQLIELSLEPESKSAIIKMCRNKATLFLTGTTKHR